MSDWYVSSAAWTAIAQFAASGVYTLGQIVRPLTAPAFNAQYAFRCTTAGTASTEPAWPANNNATVTTGGATFTNVSGQSAYGWSAAAGNYYALTVNGSGANRILVGDHVFLSSDHTEAPSNNSYVVGPGSSYGVVQLISVNRAGSVPPQAADYLAGARIGCTGSNLTIDNYCNSYWQGVTINPTGAGNLLINNSGNKQAYMRNGAIQLGASVGGISSNNPGKLILDNTPITFGATGQSIIPGSTYGFEFEWINTPSALGGATFPSTLFTGTTAIGVATCRGVDLNALAGILVGNSSGGLRVLFDSCRIAPGVTRLNNSWTTATETVDLVNCFDGTNIISERHTPAGDLTTDRSTTLVGGAQDDVGLYSHKLISGTRNDVFSMPLDCFWLDVDNAFTGALKTATVEIISSGSLNNTDISLMLEYLGTSSSSLASFANSLPSALTASAALPTSTATWNSPPSTPVTQRLQVTFTPQQTGRLRGLVRLGKVSTTVWVNPQVTVS